MRQGIKARGSLDDRRGWPSVVLISGIYWECWSWGFFTLRKITPVACPIGCSLWCYLQVFTCKCRETGKQCRVGVKHWEVCGRRGGLRCPSPPLNIYRRCANTPRVAHAGQELTQTRNTFRKAFLPSQPPGEVFLPNPERTTSALLWASSYKILGCCPKFIFRNSL